MFSPVGIVFKGSGFYRTDSRNGSGAKVPAAAKDKPSGESSSAASSDSAANGSNGSADKAGKKSETASTAAKSSSSEKVA